jgi:hypothetical protein
VTFFVSLAVLLGGLHGFVMRGPTTPVCRVGVPCSEPAAGVQLTFSHGGKVDATALTTAGGRYSVRLPAGLYTVAQRPAAKIGTGIRPQQVRVAGGASRRVDLFIDTGIR